MQSGYRADVGRNQMFSTIIGGIGDSSEIQAEIEAAKNFETGENYTINHMQSDTFDTTPEDCETIQPVNPNNTTGDSIGSSSSYTGNCCIRAYNFIIEDATINKSDENNKQLAVSNQNLQNAITNLKTELESEIYGHDAPSELLSKSEAAATYETISNHTIDRNNFTDRLALKADKETTYTKTEVNSALSTKANAADVYTKAEVDTAIANIDVDTSDCVKKNSDEDEDHNISTLDWEATKLVLKVGTDVTKRIVMDAVNKKIETPTLVAHAGIAAARMVVDTLCMAGARQTETEIRYIVPSTEYDDNTIDKEKAITTLKTLVDNYYNKNETYNKEEIIDLIDNGSAVAIDTELIVIPQDTFPIRTPEFQQEIPKGTVLYTNTFHVDKSRYDTRMYKSGWQPMILIHCDDGNDEIENWDDEEVDWELKILGPIDGETPLTFTFKDVPYFNADGSVNPAYRILVTYDNEGMFQDWPYSNDQGYDYTITAKAGYTIDYRMDIDLTYTITPNVADFRSYSRIKRTVYNIASVTQGVNSINLSEIFLKRHDALTDYYNKTESDNRYINVDEPVEKLGKVSSTTLTSVSSFLVSATTQLSSVLATFTAESSSVDFDYRNIAAWTHETRYPSDMSTVAFKLVFKITGKSDQTFDCTVSNYYSGILNDQTYSNVPCDKFFDILSNGTISCDIGDVVNVYMSFIDTSVSGNSDVASFEPEQSGHTRYFKTTTTTNISEYYNKSESDARYHGINIDSLEWTTPSGNDIKLSPNDNSNLVLSRDNEIKTIFASSSGNIYCNNIYPNVIEFGNTFVGQSQKWSGTIVDIVNTPNKSTADSASDNNKDTYVPSYRVLQENYYTKTDADARFINVDEPVELLKRIEVIPITITIPTSNLTCSDTSFSSSYQTINSGYAIKRTGTSHLVSSVSVSVSSGNISDLKLQLYLASGSTYAYTNNGDGTFSIDGDKYLYKSNGEVRLRYAKASSSAADVSFSITAVSISYDYSTTISEYYDKSYVDALEARIAALEASS